MALSFGTLGPTYNMMFKSDYTELEKRRLFLRSYQFSRKQSVGDRIKNSFFRVRKVIWVRFRSARKLRKMLWLKLRNGLFFTARRKRFFLRLHSFNNNYKNGYYYHGSAARGSVSLSSCFW